MKVLVIGGTRFIGKHIVGELVSSGHTVTVFHRGQTRKEPMVGVEEIVADRETGLNALEGRRWDVAIDTCGYVPRIVGLSCDLLQGSVDRYLFISTISVYADGETPGQAEDGSLIELDDPSVEDVSGETYGGLKVLCERRVQSVFGDRALLVRPTLVVGPDDTTDRFTYWPLKFSREGEFLAPDRQDSPVQVIDVRDLASFTGRLVNDESTGTFHVCGPYPPLSFHEFVDMGVARFGHVARPIWVSPRELEDYGLKPWTDLPLFGSFDGTGMALFQLDNAKAMSAGLELRPLDDTLLDTLNWWSRERVNQAPKAGLSEERELEILAGLKGASPH